MAGASQKGDGALMTEINVTPLVDVVLVLLVLMMVTATALAQKTIHVDLPKARSGETDPAKKPLSVSVDESGALYVDEDRLDEGGVRARAREALSRDPQVSAIVAADGRARHEAVVHALELLRSEHVTKIAIVVRAEGTR
ncbi:MAG TPA: biopolymer transporter ExbD [Labilithrix sp.]|jgi:biopolymer transport protein ExbD|nr:biopolymer transporter ExbD [Labilithrix sp.]